MKIPVRHRSKSAAFKALVLTTLFSLSIQPAAAASTIGVNDTASTVSVSERETLADSHLFQEDQAIEIDGEIGLTPAEVEQQQRQLESAKQLEEPNPAINGDMWSDEIELPQGISKQEADAAEVSIAASEFQEGPRTTTAQSTSTCSTIWPKNIKVCDDILRQYNRLGGVTSWLLYPVEPQHRNPDGKGFRQKFANGWIYWSPETGAHAVARHTASVWATNGWEAGWMGYPTSGEVPVQGHTGIDGELTGWVQKFQGGRIYRSQALNGFHVASINGLILEKWLELGGPDSPLGFPTANEAKTSDGKGRFSIFQAGSIYWHPSHGAHPVEGEILNKWSDAGYESGRFGYPIADAVPRERSTYADQAFQGGTINGELFKASQPIVTPYIYFPTEAEANRYFDELEDQILNGNAIASEPAVSALTAGKEYGPCTLYPENIHLRSSSGLQTVGFKARTSCTTKVDSIEHQLQLRTHHWFPPPLGRWVHRTEFSTNNNGQKSLYTQKLEFKCQGNRPNLFGGSARGVIAVGGKNYYARVYPPAARIDCGV